MSLIGRVKGRLQRISDALPGAKGRGEIAFWKKKLAEEGTLKNGHYKFLYTEHWGLNDDYYTGNTVLDIGCGPRGSLEWADMAKERVGIDSLSDQYKKLGADKHAMKYVSCGIEEAPFPDGHFGVVASVNSLDHVDDLDKAIEQIKRITKKGGLFLLLVEVNHPPTVCEPITLSWDVVTKFEPEFKLEKVRHYESQSSSMQAALEGPAYDHDDPTERIGMLSALMLRV